MRTTQSTYSTLDHPSVHLTVRDDPEVSAGSAPIIEIVPLSSGGATRRLQAMPRGDAPNVFHALSDPLPAGSYVARLVRTRGARPAERNFEVTEPIQELLDLRARPFLMQRIAQDSGGAVLGDGAAEQIRKAYVEHWEARHPDDFRRTPAWDRTAFLLALVAVMGAAWLVRRRGGLV